MLDFRRAGFVVSGFLLGTAGVKISGSKDAKKVYTHLTAAVMRGADEVMTTATIIKENCQDIVSDAREINEKKYMEEEEEMILDAREILRQAQEEQEESEDAKA